MRIIFNAIGLVALCALATPASAYVGPGAGLTAIGTVVALIGAVFLAIVGFLWYPIKRLVGGKKKQAAEADSETGADPAAAADKAPE
jgi:hypothetical protein